MLKGLTEVDLLADVDLLVVVVVVVVQVQLLKGLTGVGLLVVDVVVVGATGKNIEMKLHGLCRCYLDTNKIHAKISAC